MNSDVFDFGGDRANTEARRVEESLDDRWVYGRPVVFGDIR